MKDSWGNVYWPHGLNNIGNLTPGQGYQIKLAGTFLTQHQEVLDMVMYMQ